MSFYTEDENLRVALRRMEDIVLAAQRKYEPQFGVFFDAATVSVAATSIRAEDGFSCGFYGGYHGAERCVFGVWPEYEAEEIEKHFPISLLKLDCPMQKTLTHRDCLGALLGLGIKREMLGDILCEGTSFYVFVNEKIVSYVLANLEKIGSCGVRTEQLDILDFVPPVQKTVKKGIFIMSNRLDAVLAGALDLSRAKAVELIHAERVSVNHIVKNEIALKLNEDDLLSVRGFGRYRIGETGSKSRKGRTYLEIIKYI